MTKNVYSMWILIYFHRMIIVLSFFIFHSEHDNHISICFLPFVVFRTWFCSRYILPEVRVKFKQQFLSMRSTDLSDFNSACYYFHGSNLDNRECFGISMTVNLFSNDQFVIETTT